jgi:mRNA-degrading endonuclease RelE of RelBE toxin-antitoxin system
VSFKIRYHKNFLKEVKKLPPHHKEKVKRILKKLVNKPNNLPPNTSALNVLPKGVFRTRIGNLRLIYQINTKRKIIFVLGIGTRGKVYKTLNKLLT